MEKFVEIITVISDFMWGIPLIALITAIAVFLTVRTKGFQFRYIGHIFKNTFGTILDKGTGETGITPWRAVCTSLACCVGTGNITGVAVAIGMGGPGALFWMWMVAVFGAIVKYGEILLAITYRERDPLTSNYISGMPSIAKKGLDKKWHWLAHGFSIGAILALVYGACLHTNGITEAITTAFDVSPALIGVACVVVVGVLIFGGFTRISAFAEMCVPIMSLAYIVVGLFILLTHASALPHTFALIFKSAFTGQAATGGFAGSTVSMAITNGMARGVYSNEAGQGLAGFCHGNADCEHPGKQGLWGITEVFIDTIVICTFSGLVVLCTDTWETGLVGSSMITTAMAAGFGGNLKLASIFVSVMLTIFATTSLIANIYVAEICAADYRNTMFVRNLVRIVSLVFVYFGCVGGLETMYVLTDFFMGIQVLFCLLILLLKSEEIASITNDYIAKYIKK